MPPDQPRQGTAGGSGRGPNGGLSIEQIVAIESPREFRLHPRDRLVAYTSDAAGARQLFVLPLRGGYPTQLTASEKNVTDPQWSPDGKRLAYIRDNELRVIEADGSRDVTVTGHPAGVSSPRWSPDGRRLAFVSRRRGWSQVWLVDAPVPRRGRPARDPRPPEPRPLSATSIDVDDLAWSADGREIAVMAIRGPDHSVGEIHVIDVEFGRRTACRRWRRRMGERPSPDAGWRVALCLGRRRLVPGRPSVGRWPRASRPHDRGAGARRTIGRPGLRGSLVT